MDIKTIKILYDIQIILYDKFIKGEIPDIYYLTIKDIIEKYENKDA